MEVVPGPSTEGVAKSAISRKNSRVSGVNKRAKNVKNKIGNKKTEATKAAEKMKEMKEVPLPDKRESATIVPFTSNMLDVMVMSAITNTGKNDGASFADIGNYMEDHYKANMALLETYIKNFLQNSVQEGVLERIKGTDGEERFKKKKSESGKKSARNSARGVKAQAKNLEKTTMPGNENLREKDYPSTSKDIPEIRTKNQKAGSIAMNEYSEAVPGPNTKKVIETSSFNDIKAGATPQKRTRRNVEKSDTENEKTNPEAKKARVAPATESKNLERKAPLPKTSVMVLNAIKSLKKRNGATSEDIIKHIEEKQVNTKVFKSHVSRFLNKGVDEGVLEKLGSDAEGKYKIKAPENVKKDSPNVHRKVPEAKSERKKATPKKATKRKRV